MPGYEEFTPSELHDELYDGALDPVAEGDYELDEDDGPAGLGEWLERLVVQ